MNRNIEFPREYKKDVSREKDSVALPKGHQSQNKGTPWQIRSYIASSRDLRLASQFQAPDMGVVSIPREDSLEAIGVSADTDTSYHTCPSASQILPQGKWSGKRT